MLECMNSYFYLVAILEATQNAYVHASKWNHCEIILLTGHAFLLMCGIRTTLASFQGLPGAIFTFHLWSQ